MTPGRVVDGMLVVVAVACAIPGSATSITVTGVFIFSGFIDAHNHVASNILPTGPSGSFYQNGVWPPF